MATQRKPGRKAAKNETAAALLNALAFCGVLKAPTTTSLPSAFHIWLNSGYAVAHNGIVAAGHPISAEINGYPNTKLLGEALANCGKEFVLTVRDGGAFEIQSGSYHTLVPSLDYSQVIPTPPDPKLYPLNPMFVPAIVAAGKVVSEADTKLIFASVRLHGQSVLATDGITILEAWHGNTMPEGMVLPKEFVTALAKTAKIPTGFGVAPNLSAFTVWFEDNSWLRTNVYDATWPADFLAKFPQFFNVPAAPIDAKVFNAVNMVLPFTEENNRVIFRTGMVKTNPDARIGASIEVPEVNFTIDIDGKRLLAVADHVESFGIGQLTSDSPTFTFYGNNPTVRGVIVGLPPLPDVVPVAEPASAGGWTTHPEPEPEAPAVPAGPSWGVPQQAAPQQAAPQPAAFAPPQPSPGFVVQTLSPQPVQQPQPQYAAHQVAQPRDWVGGPPAGLATDPEYLAQTGGLNFGGGTLPDDAEDEPQGEAEFNGFGGWLDSLQDTNE